ncbi:hypothetical protein NA57DRAFT_75624 [Rhizodiscina lignyota]|uniref:Uncharacterized protein n=1 Tax=Rhizodiscina lignyota TaxID=1504668 RepID=A0A9P4IFR2_9PEZI|nr:hypothetical protein NA57DRAFT_75624 [Rhizodiscina lignyota]
MLEESGSREYIARKIREYEERYQPPKGENSFAMVYKNALATLGLDVQLEEIDRRARRMLEHHSFDPSHEACEQLLVSVLPLPLRARTYLMLAEIWPKTLPPLKGMMEKRVFLGRAEELCEEMEENGLEYVADEIEEDIVKMRALGETSHE